MPFTTIYFREAEAMIKSGRMKKNIVTTLEDLDQALTFSHYRGITVKSVLHDAGWREDFDSLNILAGRRYRYKGIWRRIAVEANLNTYEYLWEGLFRLQLGFDRGGIDAGILILPGNRSDKSPLGNSVDLVKVEVEELFPTISLPVMIVLYQVGVPTFASDEAMEELPDIQPAMEVAL